MREKTNIYNNTAWQRLRGTYIRQHPVCEMCERYPADEVHHKNPVPRYGNESEQKSVLLDWGNLMSLCSHCHHHIHNADRRQRKNEIQHRQTY